MASASKLLRGTMLLAALGAPGVGHALPISYWTLDEGSGTVAYNSVADAPDADLRNGPTWVAGRFGNALSFDGVNDYLNIVQDISETQNTVSLWVRSTAAGAMFSVNAPEQGGANDRNVWLSGGNISGRIWSDETITTSGTNFADGNWHHVVHQYGPGVGHRLYVDGVLRASGTKASSDFGWQSHLHVGWSNFGGYLNGQVDDVAVWDEVLPERYIRALAAGNNPLIATANWTGGVGAWENGANWSTNPTVPGPSHDTFVAGGGTAQITAATGTANPGMLTIGGATPGTVSLNGGTLSTPCVLVGAGGTLDIAAGTLNVPTIEMEGGTATVAFTNTTAQSYSLSISGDGSLTKSGAGVLTLGGVNSYTGATLINEGTLRLDSPAPSAPLAGALLWLDAADPDPTHIVKDASNYVSVWKDAAGGAGQVAQADASRQPVFTANQINGLPVIHFSTAGTADQLFNTTNYTSPVTVLSISRLTGGANARLITSNANNWLLGYWGGGIDKAYFEGWVSNPSTSADTRVHLYEAVIRGGGQSSDLYVFDDRDPGLVLLASNTGGTTGPNGLSLGTSGVFPGEASNGDVAEVLIYSGALTPAQRMGIENYLIAKWLNLPTRISDVIPDNSPVTIGPTATLDLNNCSETIGPLSGSGALLMGAASLTINGTANAAFSGSITGTGGLRKLGAGSQSLTGTNNYAGGTLVRQGTLDLGSSTTAGSAPYPVLVGDAAGLAATLTLSGGSLTGSYAILGGAGTGNLDLTNANVTLNADSGAGTLILGLNGTGTLTQAGGTVTANNGYVILGRYGSSQGTYDISSGTLKTAGTSGNRRMLLAWDSANSRAFLNLSGTAQVIVNADNSSAGGATGMHVGEQGNGVVTIADSASLTIYGVGDGEGALSLGRRGNSNSSLTQTGGTVTLYDNHFIAGRWDSSQGTVNISGGTFKTAGASGNRRMHLAWDSANARGTMNLSGTAQVIVNADNVNGSQGAAFYAGYNGNATVTVADNASLTIYAAGESWQGGLAVAINGGTSSFTQTGGTVTLYDNYLMLGRYNAAQGTLTVNGGSFTQTGTTGDRNTYLGRDSASAGGYLNVGGTGSVSLGNNLVVGGSGTGVVTLTGGSLTVPGSVILAQNATGSGTLALNGGVLTTSGLSKGAGTAAVTFNGGTLRAGSSFATSLPMTLDAGGGTIDTNGNAVALTAALTGAGGLTKAGNGTLVLAEPCTYGGPTTLLGGTLQLGLTQPLGGRAFWLDASQAGTLTTDGTGKISQWRNADNAAQAVSQATSTAQPTLLAAASGINNLPVASFNVGGVQTYLLSDPGDYANATNQLSVFMVGRQNPGGQVTYAGLMSMVDNWANPDYDRTSNVIPFLQNGGTANSWGSWRQNAAKSFGTIPAASTPFIAATIFDGANDTFYVNGVPASPTATSGNFNTQWFSVGSRYWSGSAREKWNGDLGELLIYNRALTAGERELVTAYLTRKWLTAGAPPTADYLPVTTALAIAQGATLDLSGMSQTVASLADAGGGGGGAIANSAPGPVTLTLNPSAGATAFSGAIGGGGGGAIALVKNGAGTQALSGTSTYTGGTTINAGTLQVDGSIPGPVDVDGGWLIGAGSVNGAVNVNPLGSISAGDSPGHLIINGAYLQAGTMLVELAGTAQGTLYDWIEVFGAADLRAGSVIDVDFVSPFVPAPGAYFDILTATEGIMDLGMVTFDYSDAGTGRVWWESIVTLEGGEQALRLTSSPEPATLTLLALGALALRRRRTARRTIAR